MDKDPFNPKSIAIIGGSSKKGSIGDILIKNLLDLKYPGKIYPVNPKYEKIGALKCFSTVLEIGDEVDLAVIAIPSALTVNAVQECAWRNKPIKNIIIISAGFSESGEEGKKLEDQLKKLAEEHGLNIIGPNCLGLINATKGINISFSKNNFTPGNIGLIMQSGAFTTALFDMAKGEGLGFSLVATLGNKAVLDESDFLARLAEDKNTKVLGLYIEDVKRSKKFMEILSKTSIKKPVVVLKAGNSEKSAKAILSHTGAMAGGAEAAREAIEKNGGIFVSNLFEFIGMLKFFSGFKQMLSDEIAIITNAGGPGVVTTDIVASGCLRMKEFSSKETDLIVRAIPRAGSAANPIDVLGDAGAERYEIALDAIAGMNVGAALAIVTPQAQTDIENIAKVIGEKSKNLPFPVLPVFLGLDSSLAANKEFSRLIGTDGVRISNFSYPDMAVIVLEKAWQAEKKKRFLSAGRIRPIDNKRVEKAGKIFEAATKEARKALYYSEGRSLANLYLIKTVKSHDVMRQSDAKNIFKKIHKKNGAGVASSGLVLKVDSPSLLHKNAEGGLALGITTEKKLLEAFGDLREKFKREKFIIQPQIEGGFEVIIGIKNDPDFGQVILAGIGGIMTEIFDKKLLWLSPISKGEIEDKIRNSFFEKLFQKQSLDIRQLAGAVEKVSRIAAENPQIQQMDINPMIFYKDRDPVCVDIKIIISGITRLH